MKKQVALVLLIAVAACPMTYGQSFFSEDFNDGGTAGAVSRGWEFVENEFVGEVGSNFVIAPEWPEGQDGPSGNGMLYPPTADGTVSDGGFLIADSDAGDGSDNIGSLSEIWAVSPKFSTVGASEVWFHADTEMCVNNNGECLFLFDASADGGATWLPVWIGVEPERVIDSFNNAIDTESIIGGWPELGSASQTKSFGGIHGRWHMQLPAEVAGKAEVQFRIGFYEPADAWWIVMDNIVVDSNPAPMGAISVFSEDFENGIPDTWANTTGKTQLWDTKPLWDDEYDEPIKYINDMPVHIDILRMAEIWGLESIDLNNPDEIVNPKGITDGGWVLMLAGQNYAMWQEGPFTPLEGEDNESATLDTPVIDLSNATAAFLDFDSEVLVGDNSVKYEVYVSADGGANFDRIFTYTEALMDYGEGAYFMHHYFEVPQAAGSDSVIFRFRAEGQDPAPDDDPFAGGNGNMEGFWVIDNVNVTANEGTPVPAWMLY